MPAAASSFRHAHDTNNPLRVRFAMFPSLQVTATVLMDGESKFHRNPDEGDNSIMSKLQAAGYADVEGVKTGCRSQKPPRPYTTARLQQDASRFLGFTAKQTMTLAQSLFEGKHSPQTLHALRSGTAGMDGLVRQAGG